MNIFFNFNRLPWKYVLGMNLAIIVMAVTFMSTASVKQTTENRSQAKEVPYGTSPTPLAQISINPNNPPQLINPDISWGKVGDAVVIKGKNLGSVPFGTLKLGDTIIPSDLLVDWTPNQIVFTIPDGSTTGIITLTAKTTTNQEITLSTEKPLTITSRNQP